MFIDEVYRGTADVDIRPDGGSMGSPRTYIYVRIWKFSRIFLPASINGCRHVYRWFLVC